MQHFCQFGKKCKYTYTYVYCENLGYRIQRNITTRTDFVLKKYNSLKTEEKKSMNKLRYLQTNK